MRFLYAFMAATALVCFNTSHANTPSGDSTSTIRMIVPFGAGGATDILGRLIALNLSEVLKQPIVVDNKGGAGSRLGTELAARAAPDGRTLLLVDTAFSANTALYSKLPYDPIKDFEAVALVATAPVYLVVHPSLPAPTLSEFVALARRQPLQSASVGTGSATTLAGYQLGVSAGIKIQEIPYKGAGPAMGDLLSGQVPIIFIGASSIKQHVSSGKLRALAVSGSSRAPAMPNVPTFAEQGVQGVDSSSTWGVLVPARTPKAAVERINAGLNTVLRMPEVRAKLGELGFAPRGGTSDQFRENIATEIDRWRSFVKATGVKIED